MLKPGRRPAVVAAVLLLQAFQLELTELRFWAATSTARGAGCRHQRLLTLRAYSNEECLPRCSLRLQAAGPHIRWRGPIAASRPRRSRRWT